MKRRDTGIFGEKLAEALLQKIGYEILEMNYRCPEGEIDIVARRGDTLVFLEVRTKKSHTFGTPEESITPAKKTRLMAVAEHYRQDHDRLPPSWRIDVVAIELDNRGKPARISLIENAVEE
jgi:putative endonuclease